MSILSSGYMDTDGPEGPALRFFDTQPRASSPTTEANARASSPAPLRGSRSHRSQLKYRKGDPWSFPKLNERTARWAEEDRQQAVQDRRMKVKPFFTPQQYAAMGDFLMKAPIVLEEREREKQKAVKKVPSRRPASRANIDPWEFAPLPPPPKRTTIKAAQSQSRGKRAAIVVEESDSESDAEPIFRPRKGKEEQTKSKKSTRPATTTAARSKSAAHESSRRSRAPSPESHHDSGAGFGGLFGFENDEDNAGVDEGVRFDTNPEPEPEQEAGPEEEAPPPQQQGNGKKNKKQQRKEAKAQKAAEKAAAARAAAKAITATKDSSPQKHTRPRDTSPSPGSKVAGWDMDPHSKPASRASRSHRSTSNKDVEDDTWGGTDMGEMLEEGWKSASRSHRSHRSSKSREEDRLSFPVGDHASGAGSKKSSEGKRTSNHEASRKSGGTKGLATIHEDEPFAGSNHSSAMPGGWAEEEEVWEPRNAAGSHTKRTSSSSHHSRRRAAPEAEAEDAWPGAERITSSKHSSRRSSHRSHRDLGSPPSPAKASLASYRAPEVEEKPDGWSPGWERNQEKNHTKSRSRSHHSVSSHRAKSSFEHAINKAGEDPPASYRRSHRSGSKRSGEREKASEEDMQRPFGQSYRSKSTEKVNEWFEKVPLPSEKALSQQAHSNRSSRHSPVRDPRSARDSPGWENGDVPPDASVGTGYGKRGSRSGSQAGAGARADDWEKRTSSGSEGRNGSRVEDWEKRTSSGSSTRADLGTRKRSIISVRSSRKSWVGGAPEEPAGEW